MVKVAKRNRLFVEEYDNARTKGVEETMAISEEEIEARTKRRGENISANRITQGQLHLMLAVSAGRTAMHWGHRHYCVRHKTWLKKEHLTQCDLLLKLGKITRFNALFEASSIYDPPLKKMEEITNYFARLEARIEHLTTSRLWIASQRDVVLHIPGPPAHNR
mmetsp:Transcript_20968/g.25760  ORF Transcript_20968/g.25760 Transcript_20968/m.25760 type:complete len:163 (-) Transcript_20968:194-682(-)